MNYSSIYLQFLPLFFQPLFCSAFLNAIARLAPSWGFELGSSRKQGQREREHALNGLKEGRYLGESDDFGWLCFFWDWL